MGKKHSEFFAKERGSIRKKWQGRLAVALLFPNVYRVGMSNLGFQTVYGLVNNNRNAVCERFFMPDSPTRKLLSIESGRPLTDFPIVLCSISFEEDYLNLLYMLRLAAIEPLAEDRACAPVFGVAKKPFLIAGGVATFINPEPLAPFIDLFVIGEAEPVLDELLARLCSEEGGKRPRTYLLKEVASSSKGFYAPSFYQPHYLKSGVLSGIEAAEGVPLRVSKVVNKKGVAGHSAILTPYAEFSDMYLAELGRGCSCGCRFCAAGFVYRPPRQWSSDAIIAALSERPAGVDRVGLLGMEMVKGGSLKNIATYLLEEGCSLSFSSLRADAISPQLIALLSKSGLKTATMAPDGGSDRLRRVINKRMVEDDFLRAAEQFVRAGIRNLKLYFMIGLPTETMDDMEEIVRLTVRIKSTILDACRPKGRMGNITLSVNSFVPKPWTPFQYHPFAPLDTLKKRLQFLRKEFAGHANIRMMSGRPKQAFFQAVLSRGDRRIGRTLLRVVDTGKNWHHVMRGAGIAPEFYAMRRRERGEAFPWDIIDHGISRDYLWNEYQKALTAGKTPSCDTTKCRRCGVCRD